MIVLEIEFGTLKIFREAAKWFNVVVLVLSFAGFVTYAFFWRWVASRPRREPGRFMRYLSFSAALGKKSEFTKTRGLIYGALCLAMAAFSAIVALDGFGAIDIY
ncbi:MAG: hypothetical protein NUW37_02115 [Planctomycetes bacterium]|nr:hypothetical protein [Planctomycetota bacterium]